MRGLPTKIRANYTIRVNLAVIRIMTRVPTFEAITGSIKWGIARISHVAKVPALEALDGSRPHHLDPRDRPTHINLTSSR